MDVFLGSNEYGNPWRAFARTKADAIKRSKRYNPHEDWTLGRQLVKKCRMGFGLYSDSFFAVTGLDDIDGTADGLTHLIAACLAITAAKLGDTVQAPQELMPQTE